MSHVGRDPFETPPELRDGLRRLRGRLAAPVTVWTTTGPHDGPVGLTVSSIVAVEGEPPTVVGLVGPLSDFWTALQQSKHFVVHVLGGGDTRLADLFAGRLPGDPFDDVVFEETPWGPALGGVGGRAYCRLIGFVEVGYSLLVRGELQRSDPDESLPGGPLVHYRGGYRTVTGE